MTESSKRACHPEFISWSRNSDEEEKAIMRSYFVYILTNKANNVIYIGVTNDIARRISEHREKVASEFTAKYNVIKLVHCEEFSDISEALEREKQLKRWHRQWKINLITENNPSWKDLSDLVT